MIRVQDLDALRAQLNNAHLALTQARAHVVALQSLAERPDDSLHGVRVIIPGHGEMALPVTLGELRARFRLDAAQRLEAARAAAADVAARLGARDCAGGW